MKTIEVICPTCGATIEVELPEKVRKARGQLSGIAIEDMTDEQLKREIINANSVLYKAQKRGASDEVITANQERLDAAKAERDKRKPVVVVTDTKSESVDDVDVEANDVYDEETATEL